MSLVREALEKAEHEAAARAAREHGLAPRLTATGQPYRARRQRSLLLPALAIVGLAAVIAALLWSRETARSGAGAASVAGAPVSAGDPSRGQTPTRAAESQPDPTPAQTSAPAPTEPVSTIPAAAVPQPPATAAGRIPDPSLEDSAAIEAAAPGGGPPAAPKETFVRELTLRSGATIRLGGIAWSDIAPLAYLNGKLLAVGETVAGCRIEKIARDRIELAQGERRLVLTLR